MSTCPVTLKLLKKLSRKAVSYALLGYVVEKSVRIPMLVIETSVCYPLTNNSAASGFKTTIPSNCSGKS